MATFQVEKINRIMETVQDEHGFEYEECVGIEGEIVTPAGFTVYHDLAFILLTQVLAHSEESSQLDYSQSFDRHTLQLVDRYTDHDTNNIRQRYTIKLKK